MTSTLAEKYPHLLSYKGFPVPWVTRWTHERPTEALEVRRTRSGISLGYSDGRENRESNGILWIREGITRGGEPEFSQVSAYRQRAAMVKCRCQVCGKHIPDQVLTWLFAEGQLEMIDDGRAVTMNPPVCEDCAPIAIEVCPHLKKSGFTRVKVLEYRIWGVSGEVLTREGRRLNHQLISYDKDYPGVDRTAVVAKQQVVELTKFTIEA